MRMGVNIISFDDDYFTMSSKHVEGICWEIKKRKLNIKWIAHARVDNISASLLQTMKEAGCILLRFGIESGSKRIIKIFEKTDASMDWIEKSKDAFRISKDVGIPTVALFIIGSPTESAEEVKESIKLAKDLAPDLIQVHYFTPYPGSASYKQFKSKLDKDNLLEMHHYKLPIVNLSNIEWKVLERLQLTFYREFLLRPEFFFQHLIKYIRFYFYNRYIFFRLLKTLIFRIAL